MPCTQTGSLQGDHILALENTVEENAELITKMTAIACEALRLMEDVGVDMEDLSQTTLDWWEEHKKVDQEAAELEEGLDTVQEDVLNMSSE